MIHFIYLIVFALIISVVFGLFTDGDRDKKLISGMKIFAQFIGISLLMAWVFYFIPW